MKNERHLFSSFALGLLALLCALPLQAEVPGKFTYSFNDEEGKVYITGFNTSLPATETEVTIPATIPHLNTPYPVAIADSAFIKATSLIKVELLATTPPDLGQDVFTYIPQSAKFICPANARQAYTNSAAWRPFFPPDYSIVFHIENAQAIVTAPNITFSAWGSGILEIPDSVYANAGRRYPVTTIAAGAFRSRTKLANVILPATITRINANAFAGCSRLATFRIDATDPPTLADGAFANIPTSAIFSCPDKTAYTASAWQPFFPPAYNILFSIANNQATVSAPNKEHPDWSTGKLILPEAVYHNAGRKYPIIAIGDFAFRNQPTLQNITLPSSITHIGSEAFAGCTNLDTVHLLSTRPPELGRSAFDNIPHSACFTVPDPAAFAAYSAVPAWQPYFHVEYPFTFRIEQDTAVITGLNGAAEAADLTIPAIVYGDNSNRPYPASIIAPSAFKDAPIVTLTLPATLTRIDSGAFAGCTTLETVTTFALTPPVLGKNVFIDVPLNTVFTAPETVRRTYEANPDWQLLFLPPRYDVLFRIEGDSAIVTGPNPVSPPYAAGHVTIPDVIDVRYVGRYPVKTIGKLAFAGHLTLNEVIIPATVTAIGAGAFAGCESLTDIVLKADVPPLYGLDAFAAISNDARFTCPDDALEDYRLDPDWVRHFPVSTAILPAPSLGNGEDISSLGDTPVRLYDFRGKSVYSGPADAIPAGRPAACLLITPSGTRKILR